MKSAPLELYSFRRCPYAIRVRTLLHEKGIPFRLHEEDLSHPSPEFLRLHPRGAVPLLVAGDFVLPESAIINEYLEEVFPEPRLLGMDPQVRACVRLWTAWCDQELKPDLDSYKYAWESLAPPEQAELSERLKKHLQRIEVALLQGPYLLGVEYTLADIHVYPFYRQLSRARADFEEHFGSHRRSEWLARILARPAVVVALAKSAK